MKPLLSYVFLASILIFLFCCPFAIDNLTINPTQFGQFSFLLYGSLIHLLVFVVFRYFNMEKVQSLTFSRIDILLIMLFLVCTIRTLIAYGGLKNLPINYFQVPCLLITYFIFRHLPQKWLPFAIITILFTGSIQAIYGNAQLYNWIKSYNGIYKITGTFYNPGPFAGFLSIIFPVSLNTYLYRKKISSCKKIENTISIFSIISIIAIIAILPSSRSRAAIIATIFSVVVSLLFYYSHKLDFKKELNKIRYLIYPVLAVMLVLLMFFLYSAKKKSADGRLLIWESSVPMILDAPIFGYGFGKFAANYMNYQAKYFSLNNRPVVYKNVSDNVYYPYNEFIRITVEYGIIGSVLVILLLISIFKSGSALEGENTYLLLAKMGTLSFIIFSFFSYSFEIIPILIIVTFYLSLIARFTNTFSFTISKGFFFISRKGAVILSLLILLPLLIFCWINVYKIEKGYRLWNIANLYYQSKAYDKSINIFKEAGSYIQNDGLFLSHFGKALAMNSDFTASIPILFKSLEYVSDSRTLLAIGDNYKSMGNYSMAETFYRKASLMVPSQLYPKYCLAKLLMKANKKQEAKNVAKEILTMDIKIPSPATSQINLEMSELLR